LSSIIVQSTEFIDYLVKPSTTSLSTTQPHCSAVCVPSHVGRGTAATHGLGRQAGTTRLHNGSSPWPWR